MTTRPFAVVASVVVFASAWIFPAAAQQSGSPERFALLIGNHGYQPGVGTLDNPKNDVDAVESSLQKIGFLPEQIVKKVNVEKASDLLRLVQEHTDRVKAKGAGAISFFYYSGHGASSPDGIPGGGKNYIIPTGIVSTTQPDFWQHAVALETINDTLQQADSAIHIVIFDACRTLLKLPQRGGERGFVPVALNSDVQMLIAFSTSPKRVAYDKIKQEHHNGPYAHALAEELLRPGADHLHLFSNVRVAVRNLSARWQTPWLHDGLWQPLFLNAPAASVTDPGSPEKCAVTPVAVAETPINWREEPGKSQVRFKAHSYTYAQAEASSRTIEEVDAGVYHRIKSGTRIFAGMQGDEVVWYRYERNAGPSRPRYVIAAQAELLR